MHVHRFLRIAAIAALASLPIAYGVAQTPPPPPPPAIHDFTVGDLRATALKDGGLSLANDGSVRLWQDTTQADLVRLLGAAGQPTDRVELSVQPLLVRAGRQLVLIDTGYGPGRGSAMASLALAGVKPADITDIVISHPHGDHVGGLVADGKPAFPNARVLIAPDAWAAMQANPQQAALVAGIAPRVTPFAPGGQVAPGVRTRAIVGHTPGHVGVELESRGRKLLYVADTVHHFVVSLAEPERRIAFDSDAPTAERSRRALLTEAARDGTRVYAVHFPWPGLGRVKAEGQGFVWVPEVK